MTPDSLQTLIEQGVIHRIIRPLMSGKEAQVFLVEVDGVQCVAKIYKEAEHRSFKHRAVYTEGRRSRNSRQQRAIAKRSRYGKEQEEEAWKNAEVDAIYLLRSAGVRVPEPYAYVDGVLVMELISDAYGEPAPRLIDVQLTAEDATDLFHTLLREVVRMLCVGLVHGDLSDFNVLLTADGPVIIDFPQAVDAAANNSAQALLIRDVKNLQSFLARWVPDLRLMEYGQEMWELYQAGTLLPDTVLTGKAKKRGKANTESILLEIQAAVRDERSRREALGLDPIPQGDSPSDPMVERMLQRAREEREGGGRKRKRAGGTEPSGQPSRGRGDDGDRGGGRGRGERGNAGDRSDRDAGGRGEAPRGRGGDDRGRRDENSRGRRDENSRGRRDESSRGRRDESSRGRRDDRGRGRGDERRSDRPPGRTEARAELPSRGGDPTRRRNRRDGRDAGPPPPTRAPAPKKPAGVDFGDLDALLDFED